MRLLNELPGDDILVKLRLSQTDKEEAISKFIERIIDEFIEYNTTKEFELKGKIIDKLKENKINIDIKFKSKN